MLPRLCSLLALLAVAAALLPAGASAQTDLERSRLNTAAYYNYSEEGDITIRLHVWGAVRYPGLYEVRQNTRLMEIISLAGGPQTAERTNRQSRSVRVRLEREAGAQRSIVFDTTMKNSIVVSDRNPMVQDGDVLAIESVLKQGVSWRDIFPIISSAATIALLIDRFATTSQ